MNEEQIKKIIIEVIESVCHVNVTELDENLFGDKLRINAVDMVYVIDDIEKRLGKPVASIFTTEDHNIMTVNRLAQEIYKVIGE